MFLFRFWGTFHLFAISLGLSRDRRIVSQNYEDQDFMQQQTELFTTPDCPFQRKMLTSQAESSLVKYLLFSESKSPWGNNSTYSEVNYM